MKDRTRDDPIEEPKGPEYERLAMLARSSRPQAPPDLVGRVMQAISVSPERDRAPGLLETLRRAVSLPPRLRISGPVGAVALAGLVFLLAAIVSRHAMVKPPAGIPQPDLVVHRFELVAPEARKVCLVGDFNQWELCRVPMVRDSETGAWAVQIAVPAGRHEYMFVVDDQSWVTDPRAPVRVDDGFGNQNAVVFL